MQTIKNIVLNMQGYHSNYIYELCGAFRQARKNVK